MSVEDKVIKRIETLVDEAQQLSRGNEHGQVRSEQHLYDCKGWMAAAANAVELACGDRDSPYKNQFEKISDQDFGYCAHDGVGQASSILRALLIDIEQGLLSSVADMARAETFDNFLDHAKAYLKQESKQEAGVIAGVVFEDSIRRVCEKNNISQAGIKLDELISLLTKQGVFSQTKAKRARVAAHVRTKATHAQWGEFDINDAAVTIEFTEELILNHIDG